MAAIILHNVMIYPWMLDDAFITFRYAENFALGNGFVYNIGERVEGYTTFLWAFILGIGRLIGLNIVILSKVLAATGLTFTAKRVWILGIIVRAICLFNIFQSDYSRNER